MEQNHAIAQVTSLDLSLRAAEEIGQPLDFHRLALQASADLLRLGGSEGRLEDFVIDGQIASVGSGIALSATAAGQLAVDPGGVVDLGHDHVQSTQFFGPRPRV